MGEGEREDGIVRRERSQWEGKENGRREGGEERRVRKEGKEGGGGTQKVEGNTNKRRVL